MSYLDYCVSKDITIREAMKVLDKVSPQIVFILNDGQLIASLTDGDIRRYLLKGGNITDCVEAAGNMNPRCAKDEDEAIRMYHLINFVAVPIVDLNGKIIDIYFFQYHVYQKVLKYFLHCFLCHRHSAYRPYCFQDHLTPRNFLLRNVSSTILY